MKLLFQVSFIILLILGLGFLLIPGTLFSLFAVNLNSAAVMVSRLFGAALIGLAIPFWWAPNSKSVSLKRSLVYSLFTYFLFSFVLLAFARLSGLMNSMGWALVGLHAILAIWATVILFFNPNPSRRRRRSRHDDHHDNVDE